MQPTAEILFGKGAFDQSDSVKIGIHKTIVHPLVLQKILELKHSFLLYLKCIPTLYQAMLDFQGSTMIFVDLFDK